MKVGEFEITGKDSAADTWAVWGKGNDTVWLTIYEVDEDSGQLMFENNADGIEKLRRLRDAINRGIVELGGGPDEA